ncbi:MAG: hypothetical protein JSV09_07020 [Thermoplasmata archaeon]|nr:MAG: hypothetical protein JSV09_07020 [Thermoplasmata archaeon]
MCKIRSTIIIAVFLVGLFMGIVNISLNAKADAQGDWIEEIIRDVPTSVRALDLGDVDLDGENEVVVGLGNTTYEVRMYEKENGIWKETLIADTPVGVSNLVVGDADNDGACEIVCTLASPTNQARMYEYVSGSWMEEIITSAPVQIYSMALGDADNDGFNEVVIGLANTTNDVRAYQRSGVWIEENITDVNYDVAQVAIGDADNDGKNEVVIGLDGNFPLPPSPVYITNELRVYEKSGVIWLEDNITNTVDDDIISIVIGDCDEDGKNEVCITCADFFTNSEFHTYENKSGTWTQELQFPTPPNTLIWVGGVGDTDNDGINEFITVGAQGFGAGQASVAVWENISNVFYGDMVASNLPNRPYTVIGDCDNDGVNEIIGGLLSTSYEVRIFANDRGKIGFTSHHDGEYVLGQELIEVMVTSNYVDAVRFYVDDVLNFTDTVYPYQFMLDTTILVEDSICTIKAEGLRGDNPPLTAEINLEVNNFIPVGDYISVSTGKSTYSPDQDVSVVVGLKSPPSFTTLNLIVSYADPSSNTLYSVDEKLPYNNQYMINLPLQSDAELGTYTVFVEAYGIEKDMIIWSDTNTTTFDVVGKSVQEQLDEINASILNSISGIEGNLLASIADVNASLTYDIQNLLTSITDDVAELNSSLSYQLTNLLNNMTTDNESLRTWLDLVLGALDTNLTDTRVVLETQLDDLGEYMAGFNYSLKSDLGGIIADIQAHDSDTGQNHSDINDKLNQLLMGGIGAEGIAELKIMLTNLAQNLSEHNQSIANDIIEVVYDIEDFETQTGQKLDNINSTLDDLAKLDSILADLDDLDQDLQAAQASIDDIPKEKEEDFPIAEGLLFVVIALLILNLLAPLIGRKGRESGVEALFEEEVEPESKKMEEVSGREEPEVEKKEIEEFEMDIS